jgi:crossover junction endodeoxyribonuclease RuvC
MRILGIDPGTGILGFGVINTAGQNATLVDAGVVRTKPHQPEQERLLTIYDSLHEIIQAAKPQTVSVERLFFARNVTTAMAVAQARGVVLLVAQQHGLPIAEYTPLQIKMSLTGYGKADKKQVQEMVRLLLNLKDVPKPDDCADALAAALTHAATLRLG